ncbi:MAG: ThiF family adenylyltransferase, partial [Bacillota bacterium]|nr:ThiF family adenylyltransferase [Bacillota bacterium]
MLSSRYSRQTVLPFVGEQGQTRLSAARVGILGCGALGTVVAELLTRGGIGFLRIIDRDIVELSNLQRQTLFTEHDAKQRLPKAMAAQQRLGEINSEVCVEAVVNDYAWHNALSLLSELDLIVDATDNYLTRLTLNDACLELGIPWVYGGALGTLGMTANFLPQGPCFRCLVRDLPAPGV